MDGLRLNLKESQRTLVVGVVKPKELIDLIGFDGGHFLSGKLNDEERIFVDNYYKIGRALEKQGLEKLL